MRSDDVVLRVVATNDTEHTLRPGRAALFHGTEFVGSTQLATWAPREELELALGLDDRIRVERRLTGRSAGKALVGGTRRHELRYRIEVANYGSEAAEITAVSYTHLDVYKRQGLLRVDRAGARLRARDRAGIRRTVGPMTSPLPTAAESPTEPTTTEPTPAAPTATEPSSAGPDVPGTTPTLLDLSLIHI